MARPLLATRNAAQQASAKMLGRYARIQPAAILMALTYYGQGGMLSRKQTRVWHNAGYIGLPQTAGRKLITHLDSNSRHGSR